MIRIWVGFAIVFAVYYYGIPAFRKLSGKEKWTLTKEFFFAIACSAITVGSILLFVFLF